MTEPTYVYAARLERAIDFDTYVLLADCGFNVWRKVTVRLKDYSVAERFTEEGQRATQVAKAALEDAQQIVIRTYKTRSGRDVRTFTRYVADVWLDVASMVDVLKEAGSRRADCRENSIVQAVS